MKLPKISLENYQFTIIVFLLLSVFGVNSYLNMPRTENPTVYIPGASVIVVYPGANPVDMEQLVVDPIEEAINELDDIIKINTKIQDGLAAITVEFSYNTDPDEKYNEVIRQVNSVKNNLPDDIYSIDYWKFSSTDVAMLQLALTSDSTEYYILKENAEKLKSEIEKTQGVRKVEIVACPERIVCVDIDIEKMSAMNIPLNQVAGAIIGNNENIPGGSIDIGDKTFSIKTSGSFKNLDELKNTVVHSWNGKLVYLKDIAKVYFGYEDEKYIARFNGEKSVFIVVKQKDGYNIFDITAEIMPKLDKFKKTLNKDIKLDVVFDQSKIVDNRISGFLANLFQGIIVVALIILMALGLKSAIIVSIAIPLSIFIGLGFVDAYGIGLQQITIASLVVALGLLVDNSIVMVENINRFMDMGYKPKEAAVKGASEIGWPVVSATVTTLLAFIPIAMMPEKSGDFIKGLPVTMIATLTVSMFVALSLTPMIAGLVYKGNSDNGKKLKSRKINIFEKALNSFVVKYYRKALQFALKRKIIVLLSSAIILAASVLLFFTSVGISFFPTSETPQFLVRINLPEGSSLKKTQKVVSYVESILDTTEGIKHYASNIGHGNPRIYYNVFSHNYAENYADIYVELEKYEPEEFDKTVERLRNNFNNISGAKINLKVFEQGIPVNAPIEIYINGDNLEKLRNIAADIENIMSKQKGIINIENELSVKRSDILVNINKDKAGIYGVPVNEIDKMVRLAINGISIDKFRDKSGEDYDIFIRMKQGKNAELKDFDRIYINSMSGRQIPLSQLANITFISAPSKITRYNLQRTAALTADVDKNYTLDEVIKPVLDSLKQYNFPIGYNYTIRGELEARNETFGGMEKALVIAIIAIFAVLVLQFRSFIQPVIIFISFALGIIGVIWGLFLSGNTFSFTAFVGFVSLSGIVINNAIILIDYMNRLIAEGKELNESIQIAGETRFKPIILTTLTTIGGLLPLTLTGSKMWEPLGWTIIGGLLVSTALTLLVIPVLFAILSKK